MNLQDSSLRNQESLHKKNEKRQKLFSYKCCKCKDTGWILIPQEKMQPVAITCDCQKVQKNKREWKLCGINPEMVGYKFSNFEVWNETSKLVKDTASTYFNDFEQIRNSRRNSILLCGQVGSGKSHLSIALALNLLNAKIRTVYMLYRDVITKIKQNVIDEKKYASMILKYQVCEVLLIDDLFKGRLNESDVNIMFEIINYRYLNFLPIIVSSEFTIEKMLEFDEGIGSRIYEMSKDYVVEIKNDIRNNYRSK
ncbi:putative ATP-binding protein, IstB-like [Clostridium neonatale]|uniref:DNA replication protein n=2 Tax=Clostridiaceae TaxID=31979 RepID=A0ABY6SSZ4_9CLOT|nr:putative ATP-binding protein, IstB-like [Clostridium neonatale]CAI3672654.1 putative ATP-binding protein, IstB-like [Clostridium neonatale]CAI3680477.1 putative ATP-binding protein, IstB-like [Clostridium neonatale]CAI3693061.1 putative ATP-binding protein, IstB-like [Clostridium neonatale]VDG71670.1 DNA replication protein [Clostridium carnis]